MLIVRMADSLCLATPADLPAAARRLLEAFGHRSVWLLYGQMGAGKTTLVKALCAALGVSETVQSPTFGLVNEYRTAAGRVVYHMDLYRLQSETEAYDIGLETYLDDPAALCLVEWPERAASLLPPDALPLHLAVQPDGSRLLTFPENKTGLS